jgi:hypothetical protein
VVELAGADSNQAALLPLLLLLLLLVVAAVADLNQAAL